MSEITINKNNKSISFTHNNIAFSQFGVADEILDLITDLQNQLQQKENITKEVREYVENNSLYEQDYDYDYEENLVEYPPTDEQAKKDLLDILEVKNDII